MMEFKMQTDLGVAVPKSIEFNFEELKTELAERLDHYSALVVTEDSIKDAKADRAKLNKLREALENKRKEVKKQCLAPYNAFEARVKELVTLVDRPILAIDTQIKGYDEMRKEEKRLQIVDLYEGTMPDTVKDIIPLDRIFSPKWLNATVSLNKVAEELEQWNNRVYADLTALDTVEDEYKGAVRAEYIKTLDIVKAMNHKSELQAAAEAFKAREELKAALATKASPAPNLPQESPSSPDTDKPKEETETVYLLRLEFQLTRDEANKLKMFLTNNHINYRKI